MKKDIDDLKKILEQAKNFHKFKKAQYFIMDMSAYHEKSKSGMHDILGKDRGKDIEATSSLAIAMLLVDGKKVIGIEFPGQCNEDSPFLSYVEGLMDDIIVFNSMPKDSAELRERVFDFLSQQYGSQGGGKVVFVFNPKNEMRYGDTV